MGRQVHAVPNEQGLVATCRVGSSVADWPTAQPPCTISPFVKLSLGCRLREESFWRLWRSGELFLFQTWTLSCTHDIFSFFYILIHTIQSYFSPDNMRACMCLGNIHLYATYIIQGPYVRIHLSSGYFRDHKKNEQTYLKNTASRAFKTLTKLILIRSKLHWLVHPIFYLCWVSFFWFSSYYSTFTLFFLSSRPFHHLIKRTDSPPQWWPRQGESFSDYKNSLRRTKQAEYFIFIYFTLPLWQMNLHPSPLSKQKTLLWSNPACCSSQCQSQGW